MGNTFYSEYYDKHFLIILKNAHSSMRKVMTDHVTSNVTLVDSHKTILIYREPFQRWLSAMNMVVDSHPWFVGHSTSKGKMTSDIPTSYEDQHFGFQKDAVETIDISLAHVYKFNYNVIEEKLIHEKMWRYWPGHNKRIKNISEIDKYHSADVLQERRSQGFSYVDEDPEKAYWWLKKLDRVPEMFLLYPNWEDTVDAVNEHYQDDVDHFEGVKFIND